MSGYNSEKQLIFIVIFVKICYFGSHSVFRWYFKMLNADRVSAADFLKLMVSGSQINKKTNYRGFSRDVITKNRHGIRHVGFFFTCYTTQKNIQHGRHGRNNLRNRVRTVS